MSTQLHIFLAVDMLERHREDVGGRVLSVPDVGRERAGVPRSSGHLSGHGPADESLLRQLVAQYVPHRSTVRRQVLRRDVSSGPARRLSVCSPLSIIHITSRLI